MTRLKLVWGLAFLAFTSPLRAQVLGAASGQFLSRGPGAAAAALAGSVVSIVNDPTALYWNPAGLAQSDGMISGEHLFLVGGARYDFMGLSVPSSFGSFGFGVTQLARDNIIARSSIDDPGYDVSNTQSDYMAGFAKNIGNHFSLGLSANVLDFNLAGYSDMGWGLNGGVMGHYEEDDFLGLRRVVWLMGADIDNFIAPQINLAGTPENYPASARAGGGISFQAASRPQDSGVIEHDRATLLFSLQRTVGDKNVYPALGFEYNYLDFLILRAGFAPSPSGFTSPGSGLGNPSSGFFGGLTAGIGLRTEDRRFELDYSIENDPLGFNNRFTLAYRFSSSEKSEPVRRGIYREIIDEEYVRARTRALSLAKRYFSSGKIYFNQENFPKAEADFKLAASLNPDDAKIKEAYRRAKKAETMSRVHNDEAALSRGITPGQAAAEYKAIFELSVLRPKNQERWNQILRDLVSRLTPDEYALISGELFDIEASAVKESAGLGQLGRALKTAQSLKAVSSPRTLPQADVLAREMSNQADGLKTRFRLLLEQEGSTPDAEAAQTALSVLRAFPEDTKETKLARNLLRQFKDHHPLSIRESFYLKKLYYLAALDKASDLPDSNYEARRYLDQILTDNPASESADKLLGRGSQPLGEGAQPLGGLSRQESAK